MELRFVPLADFAAAAERRVAVAEQRFAIKDANGREVLSIAPGLSVHESLTVPGNDWLPVRPDGLSTLEQMAHNPQQFLGKVRNIVTRDGKSALAAKPARHIDARALLVGDSRNYYHWLVDHLPRILLAKQYGELEGRQVIVGPDVPTFVEESLRMLGLPPARRIVVQPDEAVCVREVCVPTMLASMTVCHPMVPALIRGAVPVPRTSRGRRIYLSRQDAATRRLSNEAALVELLERHGFERHVPSEMRFEAQAAVCANADVVVAVHGAALANMLFCPPGAHVVEIFCPEHPASFFVLLARVCRLTHGFVPASLADRRDGLSPLHHAEWTVDIASMERTLDALANRPA